MVHANRDARSDWHRRGSSPHRYYTFPSTGGDVPPFSLRAAAPGCIALTQPATLPVAADAAPFSPRYLIARNQDLSMAWTGGEAGATVGVDLMATSNTATGRSILPPMPWYGLAALDDADLAAIFAYLRTIPPVHNGVPGTKVPDSALAEIDRNNREILAHIKVGRHP